MRLEKRCRARERRISRIRADMPFPIQPPMSLPVSTSTMLPVSMEGNRPQTLDTAMHASTRASCFQ